MHHVAALIQAGPGDGGERRHRAGRGRAAGGQGGQGSDDDDDDNGDDDDGDDDGDQVVLVARTRAALDTLAAQIEGEGGEAAVECCDMASTEQVRPHTVILS